MLKLTSLLLLLTILFISSTSANDNFPNKMMKKHRSLADKLNNSAGNHVQFEKRAGAPALPDSANATFISEVRSSSEVVTPSSSSVVAATSRSAVASSAAPSTSASPSSSVVPATSSQTPIVASSSSTTPDVVQVTESSSVLPPTTISAATTPTVAAGGSSSSRVTTSASRTSARSSTASSTNSGAASNNDNSTTGTGTGGLSTGAIIGIVVAAIVVGGIAIFTIVRKIKFKPSKKFDSRMKPLDFAPTTGGGDLPDPFFEKTNRRGSTSSADRQRQQFVSELDAEQAAQYNMGGPGYPPLVSGVPTHDFTAGVASTGYHGGYDDHYNVGPGPTDNSYPTDNAYPVHAYPDQTVYQGATAYPPDQQQHYSNDGYGDGYSNLQRGPSNGAQAQQMGYHPQAAMGLDNNLGRPTQGEGPYAAAAGRGQYGY